MNKIVIGIAGGTASGKTTVAEKLFDAFGNDAVMLSQDFYYKPHDTLTLEERNKLNYDHPDSVDTAMLVEHVRELKKGNAILHPTYDFVSHCRRDKWERTESAKLIIVEGILIFTDSKLCRLCDIKLFVDAPADVRFIRRLERDVNERGRTMQSVVDQYLTTVRPMHELFVEPSKVKADLIIPQGGYNEIAINMIIDGIKKKLN